jgi:hypothetical protein
MIPARVLATEEMKKPNELMNWMRPIEALNWLLRVGRTGCSCGHCGLVYDAPNDNDSLSGWRTDWIPQRTHTDSVKTKNETEPNKKTKKETIGL